MQHEYTSGLHPDLLKASISIGILAFLVACRIFSWQVAAFLVSTRIAIPVFYYSYPLESRWMLNDDQEYLEVARYLLESGYLWWDILISSQFQGALFSATGSHHIAYYWWNLLGFNLFGIHYYSPVFLNILLTFGTAAAVYRIVRLCGFSLGYGQAAAAVFLLHPNTIAWSTFTNLKDTMVAFLMAWSLVFVGRLLARVPMSRSQRLLELLLLAGALFVVFFTRFYLPFLLLGVSGLYLLTIWKSRIKYLVVPLGLGLVLVVYPTIIRAAVRYLDPGAFLYGITQAILSPQPWSIDPLYSFLMVSSLVHWVLIAPALLGAIHLYRNYPAARFFLIYVLVIFMVSAMVTEFKGPRHRVQMDFLIIWLQFHAVWLGVQLSRARAKVGPVVGQVLEGRAG